MSDALHAYVLDPLERALSTFVQQFAVILLATGSAGVGQYQAWGKAADVAAFAAILSIVTSVLTFKVPKLSVEADLAWRVLKTGVQSFFGVLIAAGVTSTVNANWKDALATAIPVMLAALVKGLAALAAPWSDGASLLPVAASTALNPSDYTDVPDPSSPYADPSLLGQTVTGTVAEHADPALLPNSITAAEPQRNGVQEPPTP